MKQDSCFTEKRNVGCGTALVVLLSKETHSEIFLGQLALRLDVQFKWLLWAVSNVFIKFAVSHVWDMRNNLRAWEEHYPVTLIDYQTQYLTS